LNNNCSLFRAPTNWLQPGNLGGPELDEQQDETVRDDAGTFMQAFSVLLFFNFFCNLQ
jgi:hypothetical protein